MVLRKKARKGTASRQASRKTKAGGAKRRRVAKAKMPAAKPHVSVPDSQRPVPAGAVRKRDADPGSKVNITITLRGPKLPDAGKLTGRALTTREFVTRYGASKNDADKVSQVLRKFGLKIDEVSLDTRSIKASGSVAQMEQAFHPNLGIYENADQGEFRDRESNYKVPPELKEIVTAVIGFGQRRVAVRKSAHRHNMASIVSRLSPLAPADIESLYRFPPGAAAGERIAVAELGGGYFAGDLAAYCKKFNRPVPKVKTISVNTPVRNLAQIKLLKSKAQDEIDNTGEVMMDVQIIAGLCPAAEISVYFATFDQKGWVDLLDRVIKDKPVVLSVSWGSAEDSTDWSKAALTAINQRLNIAAALGITICVAAGDDGTGDELTDGYAHVDFPSCSPFVLAVGGTMITEKAGKFTEQVWREGHGWRTSNGGGATGGGVSTVFDRPSWQKVKITSLNQKLNRRKKARDGRVVPDIAAIAGPPWYDLVFRGRNTYGGGTSASAPVWAALIARINALLPEAKRQRYLTPLLYQKSWAGSEMGRFVCQDITVGNNASKPKPGVGYYAVDGFDAVAGWGTPIGTSLLFAL
jgi:kumamolisin